MNYEPKIEDFEYVGRNYLTDIDIIPVRSFFSIFFKKKKTKVILITILIYILLSIFIPYFSRYTYYSQSLNEKYLSIFTKGHILGTDFLGRDMLVRVMYGLRISIFLAISISIISSIIGIIYGSISAYLGGYIDLILMKIIEIFLAIPTMLYLILFLVFFGNGLKVIILSLVITRWQRYAILVRGEILKLNNEDYVIVSKMLGGKYFWIMKNHFLPNIFSLVIVKIMIGISYIIYAETFLSFIGLGIRLPIPSLGNLVSQGFRNINQSIFLFLIPAFFIVSITFLFNILGDILMEVREDVIRS